MTATTSEIDYYTTEGHDRDAALAMLSQSRLPQASRIDDVQVQHLLQIGYRAGRQITEADVAFERKDAKLSGWTLLTIGVAAGTALGVALTWVFG